MTQLNISRKKSIQGRLVGQPQISRSLSLPSPTGGWNAVDALTAMPPTDAITIFNLVSRQTGAVVRPGYVNQAINIGNSITTGVRTVAGFNDVSRDQALTRDRLFAFTDQGIYDVTTEGVSNPALIDIYDGIGSTTVLSTGWEVKGTDAGWVSHTNFTNSLAEGGKHYLCVCDTVNGYHVYDPDGAAPNVGRWYKIKQGTTATTFGPVDPTLLIDVQQWKGRLFFTERNSSRMWYLTPGTITGGTTQTDATAIDAGSRFPHGGFLKGVWTWTYNGGGGSEDYLVAVSSTGDVVVWKGTSPESADFQITGLWYIGEVPKGRQIAGTYNGDLCLIGALGVIPMGRLVAGGDYEAADKYITHKVQNLVRNYLRDQSREYGWSITSHPSFGLFIVNVPQQPGSGEWFQLVLSQQADAWSVFAEINALSWETYHGLEFAGLSDGRVVKLSGTVDTKQLAASSFELSAIRWSLLTAYSSMETPANWKRIHFVRPLFLTPQLPTYSVSARFDFNLDPPVPVDPPPQLVVPLWDSAKWDDAYWLGPYETIQATRGVSGIGRWVALSLVGSSVVNTSLVGFDLVGDVGGML